MWQGQLIIVSSIVVKMYVSLFLHFRRKHFANNTSPQWSRMSVTMGSGFIWINAYEVQIDNRVSACLFFCDGVFGAVYFDLTEKNHPNSMEGGWERSWLMWLKPMQEISIGPVYAAYKAFDEVPWTRMTTYVANESADVMILDENFNTIVTMAKWGRSIYIDIHKFVQSHVTGNIIAFNSQLHFSLFNRSPILIHFTAFRGWVQWVGSRFDNDWAGGYSSGKWCASRVVHGYGSDGELEVWFRRVVQGCCNGMTPLHVSVCHSLRAEDTSTLKTLLEHNSDCSSKDDASEMS
ncbi:calcium-transporting ATPase 1, plasma membrane-type [Artemisia annua]|uniref:Calcium-transporting ATPase 1, plasma membrane-type n=1 Tax=Artemisia annua TaxID=35608 RepID=A0A2U1MIF5_ARTAN|nr:calcium-transporting ATPase 1, plasma membrane-type [Artemisia annua]